MRDKFLYLIILSFVVAPAYARRFEAGPLELVVCPARASEPTDKYSLLPKSDKLTDSDALPLYEKAIQAMPDDRQQEKQIQDWLALPPEQLPQEQVEAMIQKNLESLRLMARAARCKQCNWPEWEPGADPPDMKGYRKLGFLVRLWMRLEIVRGQYDSALQAMQTGFGMARHVGQGPTIVQGLVGTAIAGLTCREVELFLSGKDSPNLYWALANLPRPFIDMAKAIENEQGSAGGLRSLLLRKQSKQVLDPAYARIMQMQDRFGNNLSVLQSVEAIRHYAATHDGRLPEKSGDITDLEFPNDVITDKPLEYRRTARGAVVESKIPEGGDAADTTRYEVILSR